MAGAGAETHPKLGDHDVDAVREAVTDTVEDAEREAVGVGGLGVGDTDGTAVGVAPNEGDA